MQNRKSKKNEEFSILNETFRFDSKAIRRKSKNQKQTPQMSIWDEVDLSQRTSQVIRMVEKKRENMLGILQESQSEKKTDIASENKQHNQLWQFFGRFQNESNPDISLSQIEIPKQRKQKHEVNNFQVQMEKIDQSEIFQYISFEKEMINGEQVLKEEEIKNKNGKKQQNKRKKDKQQMKEQKNIHKNDSKNNLQQGRQKKRVRISYNQDKKQKYSLNTIHPQLKKIQERPFKQKNDAQEKIENVEGMPRYPRRRRVKPLKYWLGEKAIYKRFSMIGLVLKNLN